jgi:hypothetical protein
MKQSHTIIISLAIALFFLVCFIQASTRAVADDEATEEQMREDRVYIRFARLAYLKGTPKVIKFNDTDLGTCNTEWQMLKFLDLHTTFIDLQVKFFINKCLDEFVVAWRGSDTSLSAGSLKDWIADGNMLRSDCVYASNCGNIHNGFTSYYNLGRNDYLDIVQEVLTNYTSVKQLTIVGHSLGGALTTVSALDTQDKINARSLNVTRDYSNVTIKTRTFGSPRVGDQTFAKKFDSLITDSRRYVSQYLKISDATEDIVTGNPSALLGYYHVDAKLNVKCPQYDSFSCHKIKNYWSPMDALQEEVNTYFFSEGAVDLGEDIPVDSASTMTVSMFAIVLSVLAYVFVSF